MIQYQDEVPAESRCTRSCRFDEVPKQSRYVIPKSCRSDEVPEQSRCVTRSRWMCRCRAQCLDSEGVECPDVDVSLECNFKETISEIDHMT